MSNLGPKDTWLSLLRADAEWRMVLSQLSKSSQTAFLYAVDESQLNLHSYVGGDHLFVGALRASPELWSLVATVVRDLDYLLEDIMWMSSGKVKNSPEHFAAVRQVRQTTTIGDAESRVTEHLAENGPPSITPHLNDLSSHMQKADPTGHRRFSPSDLAAECYLFSVVGLRFGIKTETGLQMVFDRQCADMQAAQELFTRLRGPWSNLASLIDEAESNEPPDE